MTDLMRTFGTLEELRSTQKVALNASSLHQQMLTTPQANAQLLLPDVKEVPQIAGKELRSPSFKHGAREGPCLSDIITKRDHLDSL